MHRMPFRSIWISDTHLGGRNLQSVKLLKFLQDTESEYLYLVGDIFDLWKLKRRWHWPIVNDQIIEEILKKARTGTRVYYLPGNHDAMLRSYHGLSINGINVVNQVVHETLDGRKYLVLHGDQFDCVVQKQPWLANLGSVLYDCLLVLNRWYNWLRRLFGRPYHSISAAIKARVKKAVNYIGEFESVIVNAASRHQVSGLICGHIHHASIRNFGEVLYGNSGDWVESCTALVESRGGTLGIINCNDPAFALKLSQLRTHHENRYSNRCLAPTN